VSPDSAKHLVIASVVVTGVLASVKDVSRGQMPRAKVALGLVVAGVMLGALADVQPQLAGSFAALLLVSSLVNTGGAAFAAISKGVS
jgi:hypothetical protein